MAGNLPASSAPSRLPYFEQSRSAGCADAWRARDFVGGVTTQGDQIRNLYWIDAISRPNLVWTYARHLARADWIENGGAVGSKLETVAVAARNENRAAALFFFGGSSGEKIICLEARRFRILKAACGDNSGRISSCSSRASSNSRPL